MTVALELLLLPHAKIAPFRCTKKAQRHIICWRVAVCLVPMRQPGHTFCWALHVIKKMINFTSFSVVESHPLSSNERAEREQVLVLVRTRTGLLLLGCRRLRSFLGFLGCRQLLSLAFDLLLTLCLLVL